MTITTIATSKFNDPRITAKGETRATVAFDQFKTLWLNTGTLCNIACVNCYIESSPQNDRLVYLTLADVTPYLDELDAMGTGPIEIGITGGEPFMAPEILAIMEAILVRGHSLLMLTNAMRPMMRPAIQTGLLALKDRFGPQMILRVSLDHYTEHHHNEERGEGAFAAALLGIDWLSDNGFALALAGRTLWTEDEADARDGYQALIARHGWAIDPSDANELVLFPEMKPDEDPPEITVDCWGILGRNPDDIMCASQRMVVRRKGADGPSVVACTLLPYDSQFDLGSTLAEAIADPVPLNHRYCASFCVLGGGSCSA